VYLYSKLSLKINKLRFGGFWEALWVASGPSCDAKSGPRVPKRRSERAKCYPRVLTELPRGGKGAEEEPRRCPRGPKNDQRAPTSFQKCVREASLEVARNIVKNMV